MKHFKKKQFPTALAAHDAKGKKKKSKRPKRKHLSKEMHKHWSTLQVYPM